MSQQTGGYQPAQLPEAAMARLRAMQEAGGQRIFTSDLSVNEFVLVQEAGFQPLGLVMGISAYHVGIQPQSWNQNQELTVLTSAMYNARSYAMARMEAEADALGADGIVGVRLEWKSHVYGGEMMEFKAVGTAVKATDGGAWRTATGKPFTSDLSGQDLWALRVAGWAPVSFVVGTCVYHIAHQTFRQTLKQAGQNAELPNYTQGFYDARELAMSRMQAEAERDRADGIVGVRVTEGGFGWGEHAIEFLSLGTSVRRIAQVDLPSPAMVLPMS